jgi:hypothetical protein
MWADAYERDSADNLSVQKDVAQLIAQAVQALLVSTRSRFAMIEWLYSNSKHPRNVRRQDHTNEHSAEARRPLASPEGTDFLEADTIVSVAITARFISAAHKQQQHQGPAATETVDAVIVPHPECAGEGPAASVPS